ncbi:MAG: tRNA (adenosine(37)-N6)-threonylcarbamoyltransferase complex ATPase subunit type 1 TsaE [Candidatus Paceibacterota bacterium]
MEKTSQSLEQTQGIAREFVDEELQEKKKRARIFALVGDLGAGKTTFVQSVAKELGIQATIISPTFVIERIYKIPKGPFRHFIHIDAYRLESGEELKTLGWETLINDPHNLIFIEWADRVSEILPHGITEITFSYTDETTRTITFT